jgi:hypothetical protein
MQDQQIILQIFIRFFASISLQGLKWVSIPNYSIIMASCKTNDEFLDTSVRLGFWKYAQLKARRLKTWEAHLPGLYQT